MHLQTPSTVDKTMATEAHKIANFYRIRIEGTLYAIILVMKRMHGKQVSNKIKLAAVAKIQIQIK